MTRFNTISKDLCDMLELKYEPVGIQLYTHTDALPEHIPFSTQEFKSYCHAVAVAGKGITLLLEKEQMGCKLGTSVLGMEKEMEAYLDDGVLEKYGVGLFETEEASAHTLLESTYLEKGNTKAALVAPLAAFEATPQVLVFTADSEQVMWLLYALNYKKGGLQNLPQSGGALGGCADITALPILNGVANVTFLGLGCRVKSSIDGCHLMMGAPGSDTETIHEHIMAMAKPIGMLKKAKSGA